MSRVAFFFKKLITLAVSVVLFLLASKYLIPFYISIAILNLAFAIISARFSGSTPKELFNFQRNEKFFAKGGMRDLLRIPVMLFSFIHDIIVWETWGLYQIFELLVDIVSILKEAIYWAFYALAWALKLLVPFWRIALKLFVFYLIKWPWWIFRYAFQNVRYAFKWNMLRIALPGAFFTLFIIVSFSHIDILLYMSNSGITLIGIILALLPISWVFGEIASVRAQQMESSLFSEIKSKFQNGIETVRGILTYLALFVVLLMIQTGLNVLGWMPKAGFIFLGALININFLINILFIFLSLLIVFGSLIMPSFRLYNEFNEISLKSTIGLLSFTRKRILQYITGILPLSIFSLITIIPITLLVLLSFLITINVKNNALDARIDKLLSIKAQGIEKVKIDLQKTELEARKRYPAYHINFFPAFYGQEMKHLPLLKGELENSEKDYYQTITGLNKALENYAIYKVEIDSSIQAESRKNIVNETRLADLRILKAKIQAKINYTKDDFDFAVEKYNLEKSYKLRQLKQIPILFFLNAFFWVITGTLIFTFVLAYWGNFFYNTYIFRNNSSTAEWRKFVANEQNKDYKQPLLSTTLNIIIIGIAIYLIRLLDLLSIIF